MSTKTKTNRPKGKKSSKQNTQAGSPAAGQPASTPSVEKAIVKDAVHDMALQLASLSKSVDVLTKPKVPNKALPLSQKIKNFSKKAGQWFKTEGWQQILALGLGFLEENSLLHDSLGDTTVVPAGTILKVIPIRPDIWSSDSNVAKSASMFTFYEFVDSHFRLQGLTSTDKATGAVAAFINTDPDLVLGELTAANVRQAVEDYHGVIVRLDETKEIKVPRSEDPLYTAGSKSGRDDRFTTQGDLYIVAFTDIDLSLVSMNIDFKYNLELAKSADSLFVPITYTTTDFGTWDLSFPAEGQWGDLVGPSSDATKLGNFWFQKPKSVWVSPAVLPTLSWLYGTSPVTRSPLKPSVVRSTVVGANCPGVLKNDQLVFPPGVYKFVVQVSGKALFPASPLPTLNAPVPEISTLVMFTTGLLGNAIVETYMDHMFASIPIFPSSQANTSAHLVVSSEVPFGVRGYKWVNYNSTTAAPQLGTFNSLYQNASLTVEPLVYYPSSTQLSLVANHPRYQVTKRSPDGFVFKQEKVKDEIRTSDSRYNEMCYSPGSRS